MSAWIIAHPRLIDSIWAVVLFPFVLLNNIRPDLPGVLTLLWSLAYAVPLVWRRTAPEWAALGVVPAHLVQLTTGTPNAGNIVVPLVLYAVAAYGDQRRARWWLLAGWGASFVAATQWTLGARTPSTPRELAAVLFSVTFMTAAIGAIVTVPWGMGTLRRTRLASARVALERAEALDRERAQRERLVAVEERQRIAREMHDIVAHSLSVIVVQADGGSYTATLDGDPEERLRTATQALDTIKTTARTALQETRRLVGVLRADDPTAELAPSASLAQIPALLEPLRQAGRHAELITEGDPRWHHPLSAGAELAAFRAVQESVTNVIKHAGPNAAVWVTLSHTPAGLFIRVRDNGRGAVASGAAGHGLVGMHERVTAYGGWLATRNVPGGGFEVTVHVPAPPTQEVR